MVSTEKKSTDKGCQIIRSANLIFLLSLMRRVPNGTITTLMIRKCRIFLPRIYSSIIYSTFCYIKSDSYTPYNLDYENYQKTNKKIDNYEKNNFSCSGRYLLPFGM